MIAAVVLAAGVSSRLGSPKQLVRLRGDTMLERAVRIAWEAECEPVHVVLGALAERILQECPLEGAVVHVNERWAEGMAGSLRVGVRACAGAAGAILMTCDMPGVTAGHLRALGACGVVTASRYGGRNGVPAFFPAASFAELMRLEGDAGARDLLRGAAWIDLPDGELDVDTVEDVAAAETYVGRGGGQRQSSRNSCSRLAATAAR